MTLAMIDKYFDPEWEAVHPHHAALWRQLLRSPGRVLFARSGNTCVRLDYDGSLLQLFWNTNSWQFAHVNGYFAVGRDLTGVFVNAAEECGLRVNWMELIWCYDPLQVKALTECWRIKETAELPDDMQAYIGQDGVIVKFWPDGDVYLQMADGMKLVMHQNELEEVNYGPSND